MADTIKDLRKKLSACRRELNQAKNLNDRFRLLIGETAADSVLEKGWQPQKRVIKMYGWDYAWLYPLDSYLNSRLGEKLTPNLRNQVHDITSAIIALIAVESKYGIKLPYDPRPHDIGFELFKQKKSFENVYDPCVICGEDRITHDCHIIPRADGGPFVQDNLVALCPLHHHLFDHHRLTEQEWEILASEIDNKMEGAAIFARKVREPALQNYWREREETLKKLKDKLPEREE